MSMRTLISVAFAFYLISTSAIPSDAVYMFTADYVEVGGDGFEVVDIAGCLTPSKRYEISKYEVTNTEYAEFLNSVARFADPYNLYSELQESHFWGGIVRLHGETGAEYRVKAGYEKLPATFISWYDAVRYANWLHYGRPNTGNSVVGTTEGNSTSGAYDTTRENLNRNGLVRNRNANYFIPSCGEWIYAGFFDPEVKRLTRYVGGETLPESGVPDNEKRTANYYADGWALPFPHLAPVDSYFNNASSYGTYNQAGNVMEWVETNNGNQLALGGSLFLPADSLTLDYRDNELPSEKLSTFGFRVARRGGLEVSESQVFRAIPAGSVVSSKRLSSHKVSGSEWQRVGSPGNISDFRTGRGCVAYPFEISKTEITNSEYAEFLNAVATRSDPNRLYVEDMGTGVVGGLQRNLRESGFEYVAKRGFENRPVTYLSWFSLARYVNWLHFGRPAGEQVLGVTEGSSTEGAYDTSKVGEFLENSRYDRVDRRLFARNPGAKYFIPSDDEWYKAAYYDPEKTGHRKYWDYPGRSNMPPENSGKLKNSANYQVEMLGEGTPYYVSDVGYFGSHGYYEVYDMGGNVWEWLEDWRGLGGRSCWRCDIPTKGLRGGSFNYIEVGLRYSNVDPGYPNDHYFVYGGRVARSVEADEASSAWCVDSRYRYFAANAMNRVAAYSKWLFSLLGFVVLFIWAVRLNRWRKKRV